MCNPGWCWNNVAGGKRVARLGLDSLRSLLKTLFSWLGEFDGDVSEYRFCLANILSIVNNEVADELPFKCLSELFWFSLFFWSLKLCRLNRCSKYDKFWELISILEFRKLCDCGESRGMGLMFARALSNGDVVSTIFGLVFGDEQLSSDKWYSVFMDKPLSGIKCDLIDANLNVFTLDFYFLKTLHKWETSFD